MARNIALLLALGLAAGCAGEAARSIPSAEPHTAPSTPTPSPLGAEPSFGSLVPVRRAPDGSLRIRFAGGELATWNDEMPYELEQVAAHEKPDRPVVVWAGQDAVDPKPDPRAANPPTTAPAWAEHD
jgi:hypothetical protein